MIRLFYVLNKIMSSEIIQYGRFWSYLISRMKCLRVNVHCFISYLIIYTYMDTEASNCFPVLYAGGHEQNTSNEEYSQPIFYD